MKILIAFQLLRLAASASPETALSPQNGQQNVNPDTHLAITFSSPPKIGSSGAIQVFDTVSGKQVDRLDMSIPVSPSPYGNGSTKANYSDKSTYQTNIIGGMDFYYFPIIIRANVATIYLHNSQLEYGHSYAVRIDPGVLVTTDGTFSGFNASNPWTFATKPHGPPQETTRVTVAADGSGDFNSIQGAIDWTPSNPPSRITIFIREGNYDELVYFQYKSNLSIQGESRNRTRVGYPNNSAFNPPNRQGPSRRPAFSFRGVADIQLSSFSVTNYFRGQAEALLSDGVRVVLHDMYLNGSGDALTTYGSLYISETTLDGDGDTVLGYASAFWSRSMIRSRGPLTWTRTAQGTHGNVLVNCTLIGGGNTTFARLSDNAGGVLSNWPYAEIVLINTKTKGIAPVGWGPVQGPPFDTSHLRLWEFNTMDMQGRAVDVSKRLNVSRQFNAVEDKDLLELYSDPAFVLGGWQPAVF